MVWVFFLSEKKIKIKSLWAYETFSIINKDTVGVVLHFFFAALKGF